MPLPRKQLISLIDTPYYHCVSRCVRRAYLCGTDSVTGQSFEHRRGWVEERLLYLSSLFAIDICAFAVMNNHTHLVLHVNQTDALNWSDKEVASRWHKLHKGTILTQQFTQDASLTPSQQTTLADTLAIYRSRLTDISWFMRELNEPIARRANREDNCTGHFWEGRFKSQALLDQQALAACMVYVDLNPIRADIARSLETSRHTSIKHRLEDLKKNDKCTHFMPFIGKATLNPSHGIAFDLIDYIQLVELTGQAKASEKKGCISINTSPILNQLGFDETCWLALSLNFENSFKVAAGQADSLEQFKQHTRRKRLLQEPIRVA